MAKVEDLSGIHGVFQGEVKPHFNPKLRMRALADGILTYVRDVDGVKKEITIGITNLGVRRVSGDSRRYVRASRGPKGNRDKIIGLIDVD